MGLFRFALSKTLVFLGETTHRLKREREWTVNDGGGGG